MTTEREILERLYGGDGDVTVLDGRWATDADDPEYEGCWLAPGLMYWPSSGEMIITKRQADGLEGRKLLFVRYTRAYGTAQGRDAWNRMRRENGRVQQMLEER